MRVHTEPENQSPGTSPFLHSLSPLTSPWTHFLSLANLSSPAHASLPRGQGSRAEGYLPAPAPPSRLSHCLLPKTAHVSFMPLDGLCLTHQWVPEAKKKEFKSALLHITNTALQRDCSSPKQENLFAELPRLFSQCVSSLLYRRANRSVSLACSCRFYKWNQTVRTLPHQASLAHIVCEVRYICCTSMQAVYSHYYGIFHGVN